MHHDITINHVTYHVERIYSMGQSVSSIIQVRLQRELANPSPLTSDTDFRYNEHDEAAWQKEAT